MKKFLVIWSVWFSGLVLSGCTIIQHYKTTDIQKSLGTNTQRVAETTQSVKADYKKREALYRQLVDKTFDRSLSPYPKLSKVLGELLVKVKKIEILHKKLQSTEGQLNTIFAGKKAIESGSPEWDKIQSVRKDYQNLGKKLASVSAQYQQKKKAFDALLNSHYISQIEMSKLKGDVSASQNALNNKIAHANKGIVKTRRKLDKAKRDGDVSKKKILIYESRLNKIQSVLNELPPKQKKLNVLVAAFEEEVGANRFLWVGPGMRSFTILNDVRVLEVDINQTIRRYNELLDLDGK